MTESEKLISKMNQQILESPRTSEVAKEEAKKSELNLKKYILTEQDYQEIESLSKTRHPQDVTYHIWNMLWKIFSSHRTHKEALEVAMKPLKKLADGHKTGCVCGLCRTVHEVQDILK